MKWEKKDVSPGTVKDISSKYGCDLLTASILARRGILSGEDICYYLEDDPRYLRNPFLLPGMEDAVDRILAALEEKERVLVFGDRDVDGITGTALLTGFLRSQGLEAAWRLPTGDEPYGLSMKALEEFAADYGTLIITVDCGISNHAETARATELGVDVIITDHHNPQETLPGALAIVNPKLPGSAYPFRDLSGCGVAYKLTSALRFALKSELYGQSLCLLNIRPANEAWIVEAVRLRNLTALATLTETVVPGMVSIGNTRLPAFLEGQQILVWDAPLQKRSLAKIFGASVEVHMLDIAPEIGRAIPAAAGKSLLRIRELSRIARYAEKESGELDVFFNLFTAFAGKRGNYFGADDAEELQLACLGTLADIMPLRDENRIIVRQGLSSLMEKPRPGLAELLFKLDLAGRRIGTQEISWQLNPAINAAGRMGSPEKAAALFLEPEGPRRDALAAQIILMNSERKKLGEDIWSIVEPQAAENLAAFSDKLALAWGDAIPRGVTGIMANRLLGRFKVPALAASFGAELITGSLRSGRGYDLRFLLEPCADLFLDWGGHDYAAGFSMEKKNWEAFLDRLKTASRRMELEEISEEEILTVDAELPLSYLTPEVLKVVDRFEPYGEENETLNFLARGLEISDISLMGRTETKHVKLTLYTGKQRWPAVYWQAADKVKREFDLGDRVDLVFTMGRNFFNGNEIPQLVVTDLRRSVPPEQAR
jgi:single-stranded-DNA-specific exonuclease